MIDHSALSMKILPACCVAALFLTLCCLSDQNRNCFISERETNPLQLFQTHEGNINIDHSLTCGEEATFTSPNLIDVEQLLALKNIHDPDKANLNHTFLYEINIPSNEKTLEFIRDGGTFQCCSRSYKIGSIDRIQSVFLKSASIG